MAGTVLDKVPMLAHLHPTATQRVDVINPALQMEEQKLGQRLNCLPKATHTHAYIRTHI